MSLNLANMYAYLRRKYGDKLTFTYALPPSYLAFILGSEEDKNKVVFVFEEDRNKNSGIYNVSPSMLSEQKPRSSSADELNLTGSPLKDNCFVDAIEDLSLDIKLAALNAWSPEEEFHKGFSIDKARSMICSEEFQLVEGTVGSVWFLCNAVDPEKTVLLQYEFDPNRNFSRGSVNYLGVIPTYTLNSQMLVQRHFAMMRTTMPLETCIENTYHIKPHIAVRCEWSSNAMLPVLTEITSFEATLVQTFRLSECGSLTLDLMNQLRILMYIRDDILAYKQSELTDANGKDALYRCGRGIKMDELHECINKVITEVSGFADNGVGTMDECDIESVLQRSKSRRLSDLTDELWEILKRCSSYKDLKMGFNILFQCAAKCNIVNTPTNKNRLAEIITGIANRRLAIPCLTGTEPLELLLEIGLEKLQKDYEFIFTESKICGSSSLRNEKATNIDNETDGALSSVRKSLRNAIRPEPMSERKTFLHNAAKEPNRFAKEEIGLKNSYFNANETAARLAKLFQIHCILEHLLMMHVHLNLSSVFGAVCEQLLRKPARLIETIEESLTDKIEISLTANKVLDHLKGKEPHMRRIVMKSSNKFRTIQSTFVYSMENIFPPGIAECFNTEDREIVKENTYFGWLYRKIKTLA